MASSRATDQATLTEALLRPPAETPKDLEDTVFNSWNLKCIHHVLSESLPEVGWKSIMITLQFELKIETKQFQLQTSRSTILPSTWNLRRLRTANTEKDMFILNCRKVALAPVGPGQADWQAVCCFLPGLVTGCDRFRENGFGAQSTDHSAGMAQHRPLTLQFEQMMIDDSMMWFSLGHQAAGIF